MKPKDVSRTMFDLDRHLKQSFKAWCVRHNVTMEKQINEILRNFLKKGGRQK